MDKLYEESYIRDIAKAIREKNNSNTRYTVAEMGNAIRALSTGSSDSSTIIEMSNVFIATYGETTYEEVNTAYEDGKYIVVINKNGSTLADYGILAFVSSVSGYNVFTFLAFNGNSVFTNLYLQTYTCQHNEPNWRIFKEKPLDRIDKEIADLKYVPLKLLSFKVEPSIAEIGDTIASHTISYEFNKPPKTLNAGGVIVEYPTIKGSEQIFSFITDPTDVVLKAKDEGSPNNAPTEINEKTRINFYNTIYYGTSTLFSAMLDRNLFNLDGKVISDTRKRTITVDAGKDEYIYIAYPVRLKEASFAINGFSGSFEPPEIFSHQNSHNYSEDYYVYRSSNHSLGKTTVVIT